MAYGQTGSGKTHTMGEPLDALSTSPGDAGEGVIGRALGEVFARRAASPEATTVHLSYLEVYNECVYDLLATHEDREPLGVREDGGALHRGALRRRTGATKMNAGSSRSHALLTVRVATASGAVGKLVLVDLAGSERATRTGAEGARLNEGIMINKGLLALGNVVSALAERTEASGAARHVPFRDSKLTRLLRDSLGGSARTYMVACVSPCAADADETANTLRYASRARRISNVAVRHAVAETPERALIAAEAAALRSADDAEAEEASQLAASTLAEEERQMAALRAQFAEAVESLDAEAPARRLALSGQKKAVRFDDDDSDSAWESDDAGGDSDSEERKPRKASEPRKAPDAPAAGDGLDAMTVPELRTCSGPRGSSSQAAKARRVREEARAAGDSPARSPLVDATNRGA
ncbi:hypothetical protein JL720_4532 [Aureococcus anophagefferens]|nr:hypothetical protein JL720_4532 [Aureococcus anophagefferens]